MQMETSRPIRMGAFLASALTVLAGCTAHERPAGTPSRSATPAQLRLAATNPEPAIARADAATTPTGWRRYEYGPLSVAVPPGWRVNTVDPGNCSAPPPHTVTALRESTVTESSCPSAPLPVRPDDPGVRILASVEPTGLTCEAADAS